jgi:glucosamine--fructose-6-phosphate aminotransferase (isomerizing)
MPAAGGNRRTMAIQGIIPNEIREAPDAIRATLDAATTSAREVARAIRTRPVQRVWVIGNGTSYHSSLYVAGLARRLSGPADPVWIAVTAGDFRTHLPELGPADVVVGISASGEFRDVVGTFEALRGSIPTIAITHVEGSTLTTIADHVILSGGGPSHVPVMTKTFSSTLSATGLLLGAVLGDPGMEIITAGLGRAADHAAAAIEEAWPAVEAMADEFVTAEHLFVVGGGLAYAAALEAALKLKEMALVHAEASESWEMASGPATLVGRQTLVISLAPQGAARAATEAVVRHCRGWGARIIDVGPRRSVADSSFLHVPSEADERFAPLTFVPPVALLAYALASRRGLNPDRPTWTERYHEQGLKHILGD